MKPIIYNDVATQKQNNGCRKIYYSKLENVKVETETK
jgi:hypothetical protein